MPSSIFPGAVFSTISQCANASARAQAELMARKAERFAQQEAARQWAGVSITEMIRREEKELANVRVSDPTPGPNFLDMPKDT